MHHHLENVGQFIRDNRQAQGMSIMEFADRWWFNISHISRLERGMLKTCNMHTFFRAIETLWMSDDSFTFGKWIQ